MQFRFVLNFTHNAKKQTLVEYISDKDQTDLTTEPFGCDDIFFA